MSQCQGPGCSAPFEVIQKQAEPGTSCPDGAEKSNAQIIAGDQHFGFLLLSACLVPAPVLSLAPSSTRLQEQSLLLLPLSAYGSPPSSRPARPTSLRAELLLATRRALAFRKGARAASRISHFERWRTTRRPLARPVALLGTLQQAQVPTERPHSRTCSARSARAAMSPTTSAISWTTRIPSRSRIPGLVQNLRRL